MLFAHPEGRRRPRFPVRVVAAALLAWTLAAVGAAAPVRQLEALDRGVVAIVQPDGSVFVSWRLLGTEPLDTGFDVYRLSGDAPPVRLNEAPLTAGTWIVDPHPDPARGATYLVRALAGAAGEEPGAGFALPAGSSPRPYLSVPLRTPDGYLPGDASVGDLDGDGRYELVVKQEQRPMDNSRSGVTGQTKLEAYRLDGTFLWRIDLGRNIREGAHYTQFIVYDLDGDGRAEVACKTADGTVDGRGVVLGDPAADHRDPNGHILRGPEFLTVFDGLTGGALATVPYVPPRHPTKPDASPEEIAEIWGDGRGNRSDRYLACVAYLDGEHPSLVMCRGYYTRAVLAAWNWRAGKLTPVWTFDSDDGTPGHRAYRGQGNHNLSVADVDGDGRDEIVYGAAVIDDNGTGLYSTGLGHGDALHVSDLDPRHPGLEVFDIQERFDDAGMSFRDARTGEILWRKPSLHADETGGDRGEGPGRGNAFNIDPRYPGNECWVAGSGGITGLYSARGERISDIKPPAVNFGVWWDGDLLRELLDRTVISKWDWRTNQAVPLLTAAGCSANNGTKATPALSADILGDWREEVIWRTEDGRELRIYTTTVPTPHRFPTLMHDPQYRLAVAWQNVAYNQPPHPSFYLGDDMPLFRPVPIAVVPRPLRVPGAVPAP